MDDAPPVHPAVEETATAVASMAIRGAAPIADAAAEALATAAAESDATDDELRVELRVAARRLHDTRPTAISLANAIRCVLGDLDPGSQRNDACALPGTGDANGDFEGASATTDDLAAWVVARASAFRDGLAEAQAAVGRVGGNRLADGDVLLTHCHSTAVLACIEAAVERDVELSAYVKETRPRYQGHATARDLQAMGVDATLLVDGAAHAVLPEVDHVLVGADSVAADGTLTNKIGTAGLAASAAVRDVPVLVAASTIKLNPETLAGHVTPIEERDAEEVLGVERRAELGDPAVANPAFDRTPPEHLDAVATEDGIVAPSNVGTILRERYGTAPPRPWDPDDGE